jgi:aspartate/methionine/tyrosine aminotransferase
MDPRNLLAERTTRIEVSGIRRVFDLGRSLKDPVNLSIGQPHFEVPEPIRAAAHSAIDHHKNGYTPTQGDAALRQRLLNDITPLGHADRDVIVTSGTSGGLLLALLAIVNPGDEVIMGDPYFVGYPHMVTMAGGVSVMVDTYPTMQLAPDRVAAAMTPRTKAVLLCTPANPTGAVCPPAAMRQLAELCRERGVLLISDEIYKAFHYDHPPHSPTAYDPNVLVIEGFGKTYGITGWRLGYAHGPRAIIAEMMKLQQFSFVCAPSVAQAAGVAALDFDPTAIVADYRRKRDRLMDGLRGRYEFESPGGAFYLFPKVPGGRSGHDFVTQAIERNLLIIPGNAFSRRDTHFRISYAAADATLERGIEILNQMA